MRAKEQKNVVLFHLVSEVLAEVEELMLTLDLEILDLDRRHLNVQLVKQFLLPLARDLDLEILDLDRRNLNLQLLIANVVMWAELKEFLLSLLP